MSYPHSLEIAKKLNIPEASINAVLDLLAEGATIPFIARYRKDATGAMDEVQIQQIQEESKFRQEFADRKAFIEKTITEQDKMSEELQERIDKATTINELEDIYLPYKPKRKTKAQTARANGLEPLALWLLNQETGSVVEQAKPFLNEAVVDTAAALQGARDIIAEIINEDASVRAQMRKLFEQQATVQGKVLTGQEEAGAKYKDYFEFSEPVKTIPSHRMLAVMRGFMEGILRMSIAPDETVAVEMVAENYVKSNNEAGEQVSKAARDAYRRLLQPSLESEFRMELKVKADEDAINVFAENLRQLLLSSPLGSKRILAIDPGYRTGCKVVVIDEKGDLKHNDLIYVHENNFKLTDAEHKVRSLVKLHDVQAFAIGDGTAGRETEQFVKRLQLGLPIFMVNEDGASVYSASATAREEFGDYDVTVRGAVSIGRRLMDPLAELVKIDPKSIGVGQYQHDVNQTRLKEKLDQTVESCVNAVGVNLNTAGKHLLAYVSGIGSSVADNIVKYRTENGQFKDRKQLLKVARLGAKAYEQCAGFLRIPNSTHPLDASGVHPEAYDVVAQMAKDLGVSVNELIGNETAIQQIKISNYVTDTIGLHSLQDILKELKKPGLDPRSELEQFEFANIFSIEDVQVGMEVPGIVTNLTRFGAFVDIGVKQDGLVHVSEIAHKYISDPSEVLKLNDKVKVIVTELDLGRKRIALSIKQALPQPAGGGNRRPNNNNSERKLKVDPQEPVSLGDALSMLKNKFKK